jgi:hypothetical protein
MQYIKFLNLKYKLVIKIKKYLKNKSYLRFEKRLKRTLNVNYKIFIENINNLDNLYIKLHLHKYLQKNLNSIND